MIISGLSFGNHMADGHQAGSLAAGNLCGRIPKIDLAASLEADFIGYWGSRKRPGLAF